MTERATRTKLLTQRVEEFTRTLPGLGRGRVGAIHDARVAIRRLREVLPLLELEARQAARFNDRLKHVADSLGGVRECDVLLSLIAEQPRRSGRSSDAKELLTSIIEQGRRRLAVSIRSRSAVLARRRINRALQALIPRVDGPSGARAARAWRWAIDARVARRASALQSVLDDAGVVYVPAALHHVRLAVKKLRYAIELRDDVHGRRSAQVGVLKGVQGTLGRLHDLDALILRIRSEQARLDSCDDPAWSEWDATVRALERASRALHAAYLRDRRAVRRVCAAVGLAERQPARAS
jgi:CHAD domain-containing protein